MDQTGTRGTVETNERPAGWGLLLALALLAGTLLLSIFHAGPPAAKPASAPPAEFSAGRARAVLSDLLGDGAPHPVGSPANARVREKILAQLRAVGYAPEVQEAVACVAGHCARVSNVLARLPGREPGKSVLLMAHYDSVPSGPGVSDDMAGVAAILEVARILKAGAPPRHGVLLLLNEGEEAALLGAKAFVEHSPAMAEVGAVVNLEARGTAGPSLMFETSGADAWMIQAFTAYAPRPFTSSLFSTVYQYMPNNTDLTLFKQRQIPGLNFAFIENPTQYHSPLDNLGDVSPESLQHHGDNALAAVRGLTEADLANPPGGRAVFFDLFHSLVVSWPAGLSPLLGLLALGLTLAAAFLARRRGLAVWGGSFMLGFAAALASLLFVLVLAIVFQILIAGAFPGPWVAHPGPAIAVFWLLAFGGGLGIAGLMGRRVSLPGLWAGVWVSWSLFGLLFGFLLPGISYLFVVPALVAGVCGLAFGGSAAGRTLGAVLPVFMAALLWFSFLGSLYLGLGLMGLVVTAVLLSVIFSALTPLMAGAAPLWRRWLPLTALGLAVVCLVWARVSPPFSPASQRPLNVVAYEDAVSGETRLVLDGAPPFPPAILQAAPFGRKPVPPFPWAPFGRAVVAPVSPLGAPGPELAVLADSVVGGKRHLRLRLTSPRGARVGVVYFPAKAQVEAIQVDGETVPMGGIAKSGQRGPARRPQRGWQAVTYHTLPSEGGVLDVVLGSTQPNDWYVIDQTYDLPAVARGVAAARPKTAATFQEGDRTVVSRKVTI
ncbi:MAG TPA: M20/M25/M40 family metallo-hydrolase [Thermoanaerobaculia bacterium]|nr:M20/M25/M40 family metallo-hydrolase [Thermoanaerobaculia bacterium]